MKNIIKLMIVAAAILVSAGAFAQKSSQLKYYDVRELGLPVLGKGFQDCVRENDTISDGYFTRLPADLQGVVRKAVWDLGQNSAGLAVRFRTNSKCIGAAWKPLNNFGMSHMTPTGVRGLDLYSLTDGQWLFVGAGQPNGKNSRNVFIRKMNGDMREYIMYLPLYDGVIDLAIGIDSTAVIEKPQVVDLVPSARNLPIVFYGTSVTQGGCATRPGMAYPSIIGRELHRETINLGFSGNGRMDKCLGEKIAGIPASMFVIDCLANCTSQIVKDSTEHFIRAIVEANPDVPVLMVSNYCYPYQYLDAQFHKDTQEENAIWKEFARKFRKEGYNVRYIDAYAKGNMKKSPIGPDHEGTVDGVHMTDLGFQRFAKFLMKYIK
ncbi:MAG: SGNH/GDSL hydrolase family protein [Bacteroidales bacterium]|nr:SGNH/GDSL hydrolase family protein [Bacteroidales bacterium]MBR1949710.1 SGNH/GDSL hydrolase family protein [Bacteroidales bacterium]MBR4088997.1 SGNH/GDSL hydrolase family protein [Bacteroidales bacterium]